jgi:hypothetical protein
MLRRVSRLAMTRDRHAIVTGISGALTPNPVPVDAVRHTIAAQQRTQTARSGFTQ